MSMSASVPRREAPPPPPEDADWPESDCSYQIPNNIIVWQPQVSFRQPVLLNIFYRIGIYQDANFFVVNVSEFSNTNFFF